MPTVQADRLTRIAAALLRAAGASGEEADAVAVGCVNANLAGHDSHGVIAIPTYIDRIKVGISFPARSGPSCRNRRPRLSSMAIGVLVFMSTPRRWR